MLRVGARPGATMQPLGPKTVWGRFATGSAARAARAKPVFCLAARPTRAKPAILAGNGVGLAGSWGKRAMQEGALAARLSATLRLLRILRHPLCRWCGRGPDRPGDVHDGAARLSVRGRRGCRPDRSGGVPVGSRRLSVRGHRRRGAARVPERRMRAARMLDAARMLRQQAQTHARRASPDELIQPGNRKK
ncbi:hypothetical protein OKW45_004557 [Paraburkholderia sp. WSM4175]